MSWTPPTLTTPRLILRPLTMEDAPAIHEYASKEIVARYTLWPAHQSLEETKAFIRIYALKMYADKQCEPMGIALREHPEHIIGTCGAQWANENSKVLELGYALSDKYWNQGIMTEAVRAIIDHSFEAYGANRIQAHFKKENVGSGKVMAKVGMKLEGTMRERIFHNNRYWDTVHYAILRSDWKS